MLAIAPVTIAWEIVKALAADVSDALGIAWTVGATTAVSTWSSSAAGASWGSVAAIKTDWWIATPAEVGKIGRVQNATGGEIQFRK